MTTIPKTIAAINNIFFIVSKPYYVPGATFNLFITILTYQVVMVCILHAMGYSLTEVQNYIFFLTCKEKKNKSTG